MKKHRVIFINGPAKGQVFEINPHHTRIFVVHDAVAIEGRHKVRAIGRAADHTEITKTDDSQDVTTYTVTCMKGESDFWYVAVKGRDSCRDRLLAILLGEVTGERYAIGYHEGNEIQDHAPGSI